MILWGKTIKKYREKLAITQDALAKRIHITPTYLSAVENGRKEPSLALIGAISHEFRIPKEILVWDAIQFPTTVSKAHKEEMRLAKYLVRQVYNQLPTSQ